MTIPFKVFDNYPGGKNAEGTVHKLINLIPPHEAFVSPFLGNCAVLRHIRPAPNGSQGFDMDRRVVARWKRKAPRGYVIEKKSAFAVINDLANDQRPAEQRIFLFLDPPYLQETLSRGNKRPYRHMLTHEEHYQLCAAIRNLPCMVMICGLPNLYYEQWLHGWHTFQYKNMTRRGLQWEQVWMNYPPPTELHDYRYLGKNKRARLSWKRRQARWRANFLRMPALHRAAMLQVLTDANHEPKTKGS